MRRLAALAMVSALAGSCAADSVPVQTAMPAPAADLAARCQPAAVQAIADRLPVKVTIAAISNGPNHPGGARFYPATASLPAFCQVTGRFVTNEATGKTANFVATFPANWNGKYLQMGCSGHCGGIFVNDANMPSATIGNQGFARDPIIKGYASFGTDQGHAGSGWGAWAIKGPGQADEDAITDYLWRANRVLADMGKAFTSAFYAQPKIARSYFNGCSNGGRDAFVAASYFPEQFDGIIGGSPYLNPVGVAFQSGGMMLAGIRSPDADVTGDLLKLMQPIVTARCDKADGVEDGLIQNPAACDFRPERDLPRCEAGKPGGQCFTSAQIETVSSWITAVTDEDGQVVEPGFTVSELVTAQRMAKPPADPAAIDPWPGDEGLWGQSKSVLHIFSRKYDPAFQIRPLFTLKAGGRGPIQDFRIVVPKAEVARATAALRMGIGGIPENADRLIRRGGKFLVWQNLSDNALPPYMSIRWYKALAARHGGYQKLQKNVRLFAVPGSGHCSMSGPGPRHFDALTTMENWVERGVAPDALVANLYAPDVRTPERTTRPIRTMPLCKFPEMARYKGMGDIKDAANWTCRPDDRRMLEVGESGRRAGA